MDVYRLARIASRAVQGGYGVVKRRGWVHMDLTMGCVQPFGFTLYSGGALRLEGGRIPPLMVTAQSRCRKCGPCRKRKSMYWAGRARTEIQLAPRSVFGTLTMSIDNHEMIDGRARRAARERGLDFECMSSAERFQERAREFGAEVTKWLDRIRHGRDGHTSIPFRYLLVAEVHDSEKTSTEMRGRPHYHILLHEKCAGALVQGSPFAALEEPVVPGQCSISAGEWEKRRVKERKVWKDAAFVRDEAFIRQQWPYGHSMFRFADGPNSAYYVCKYISEEMASRVRASRGYGVFPKTPGAPPKDRAV